MGKRGPQPKPAVRPCTKCGVNQRRAPSSWCVPCRVALNRETYQADPARQATKRRAYRWRRIEKTRTLGRAQGKRYRGRRRGTAAWSQERWIANLYAHYGWTVDDYAAQLRRQGGGCAICGAATGRGLSRLAVDHCHATGKVRGILCSRCNMCLGQFTDDADLLRQAAAYLDFHKDT